MPPPLEAQSLNHWTAREVPTQALNDWPHVVWSPWTPPASGGSLCAQWLLSSAFPPHPRYTPLLPHHSDLPSVTVRPCPARPLYPACSLSFPSQPSQQWEENPHASGQLSPPGRACSFRAHCLQPTAPGSAHSSPPWECFDCVLILRQLGLWVSQYWARSSSSKSVTLLRLLNVAGGESISDVYDKDEIINILYSDHNSVRRMYMKK